jgi:ribosome-associated heat shock protein Hsp15
MEFTRSNNRPNPLSNSIEQQRLDKWLWCARFFKTRGLASEAIKSGRVVVNDQKAKPARSIHVGDAVCLRRSPYEYKITVTGIAKQRVPASETDKLYLELEDSRQKREELSRSIKASAIVDDRYGGKLSKKDRRERDKMKRLF